MARYKELGGNPAGLGELAHRQDGDGTIECTGKKGPWLRTSRQFGDFNLRFQYQVSPGGNSGIYVRVPADGKHHRDNDKLPPAGFEVQVLDDNAKKYAKLKDYQYCGSVYAISGATSRVSKPAGQWNTMEIIAKGPKLVHKVNGMMFATVIDHDKEMSRKKGFIALQDHGKGCTVAFRKIRLKKLP